MYYFIKSNISEYNNATNKLVLSSWESQLEPTSDDIIILLEHEYPNLILQDLHYDGYIIKVDGTYQVTYWKVFKKEPIKRKNHINEMDIYKFILDEFNNNSSNGKIKFSIGYYFLDEEGQMGGFSRRFTQDGGRFDVREKLVDDTYELQNKSFVPMSIPMLNATYLAHDKIKEVTYEPMIEFLVYAEDIITFRSIELVLQEIRARLIQYQTNLEVTYVKDSKSAVEEKENLKVVMMAGEIHYGEIVRVAGKSYLSIAMPLTLEVSNHGEYANQEKVFLSVPSVVDLGTGDIIEVEIDMLSWNWGVGVDTEPSQVLNSYKAHDSDKAKMVRHIPKSTAFSYSMAVYMDFKNPILRKIYKDSRNPTPETSNEKWTLESIVYEYNEDIKAFEIAHDLGFKDEFYLDTKVLANEISKGEKIIFTLSFVPAWTNGQ